MNEPAPFPDLPPEIQAYIRDLETRNAQLSARVRQLEEHFRRSSPKSLLGEAITYARNQWLYLRRYADAGDAPIDNNLIHAASGMNPVVVDWQSAPSRHNAAALASA